MYNAKVMSRHSKWSKIKHTKGAADVVKGKVFTKLGRAISVAARHGGDPITNFQLRIAIDAARAANMPKETVERAIRRGTGEEGGGVIEEVLYEGYGPGSVAIVVEGTSDNKNRTAPNIRHIFSKHNGSLGGANSVLWMFERRGVIRVPHPEQGAEELILTLIDLGAEDVKEEDDGLTVLVSPDKLEEVKGAIEQKGIAVEYAEREYVPKDRLAIGDPEVRAKGEGLIEELDEDDDVANVYTNADI